MFRPTKAVLVNVFLLVFSLVVSSEEIYRNCSSYIKCVPISSCDTLIYNFTALSDNDRRQALQLIQCGGSESDPMICCASCGPIASDNRIIEGNDASIDEYPWMAALNYRLGKYLTRISCGGSLINQRYVLTAVHCLSNDSESALGELFEVVLAEYHLTNTTDCVGDVCISASRIGIDKMIAHESYNSVTFANDIGPIRLNENVEYSEFIQPICLPSTVGLRPSEMGDILEICGWGEDLKSRSLIKQKLSVPVYNFTACMEKYAKNSLSASQLCAGGEVGQDACRGDSGGPLMLIFNKRYVIEGVLSFGHKNCAAAEGCESVYLRVSSFESWIREQIQP